MGSTRRLEVDDGCVDAMSFASAHVFPMVLNAAVHLDLFAIMAKKGSDAHLSAAEIVSELPTKNPEAASMLDRMLRLLVTHSVLSCSLRTLQDGRVERVYGLTPACKFLNGSNEETVAPFITFASHSTSVAVLLNLKDAVLESGNLFERVHGMSLFEYMNKDPELATTFNEAMAGQSTIILNALLREYKGFEGLKSLVDVGGGNGRTLNMIISKYPSIKGINYDLPHVIQSAPQYSGIQHISGDMFASVPKGEAVLIQRTLHNWSDERVVKVLKNIYEALSNGGKLIILDVLVPEQPETTKIAQFIAATDTIMLSHHVGKQRTAKEFKALSEAAGFTDFHVACVAHGVWGVMESHK